MHYTLFALDSTTQIAEIARRQGVDLYDYTVGGKCLKKAVDYAAQYLLHLDQWPFQMIEPGKVHILPVDTGWAGDPGVTVHMALFEMAYARWGERKYLDVIAAYGGRPVTGSHATLLHAKA